MVKFNLSKGFYSLLFGDSVEGKTGLIENMNFLFKTLVELTKLYNSVTQDQDKKINKDIINFLIDAWNSAKENCFSRLVEKQGLEVDYSFFEPYWRFAASLDTINRIFREKIQQSLSGSSEETIKNLIQFINKTDQNLLNNFEEHIKNLFNKMKSSENFLLVSIDVLFDQMAEITTNFNKVLINELFITVMGKYIG